MPRKTKRVKEVVKEVRTPVRKGVEAARFLALAAGMTVLVGGILAIAGLLLWPFGLAITGMVTGIVSGLVLLIASVTAAKRPKLSGIIILIFSLIALAVPPNGLVFGPLLGLVSAGLLLLRREILS